MRVDWFFNISCMYQLLKERRKDGIVISIAVVIVVAVVVVAVVVVAGTWPLVAKQRHLRQHLPTVRQYIAQNLLRTNGHERIRYYSSAD